MRASRIFALARTIRCASVGGGAEERLRDLLGGEAADLAQRERHLRVGRQRRVAAGEDEAQAIVLDVFVVPGRRCRREWPRPARRRPPSTIEARAPADAVDRLEAAGRDEPGARVRGHAVARPLLERRPEGVAAAPPRRGRSRRAGGSAWRRRGAIRRGRRLPPSRARCRLVLAHRWRSRGRRGSKFIGCGGCFGVAKRPDYTPLRGRLSTIHLSTVQSGSHR